MLYTFLKEGCVCLILAQKDGADLNLNLQQ